MLRKTKKLRRKSVKLLVTKKRRSISQRRRALIRCTVEQTDNIDSGDQDQCQSNP